MKIKKELKNVAFEYSEETKTFSINDLNGNKISLNKVYSFAFMRFVVRIAQRNWFRKQKTVDKAEEAMVSLEDEKQDHPDQLFMFEE